MNRKRRAKPRVARRRWWLPIFSRRWHLAAALGSGLLYGSAGHGAWWLAWCGLVPVVVALSDASLRRWEALVLGWVFGIGIYAVLFAWIAGTLQRFGGMPWLPAALGCSVFVLGQSTLHGVWGLLLHHLHTRVRIASVWAAAPVLVLLEWLYPSLFPVYLANTQIHHLPWAQSVDLGGPLLLTFGIVLVNGAISAWVLRSFGANGRKPLVLTALGIAIVVINPLYGGLRMADVDDSMAHANERVQVGLVQTNHPVNGDKRARADQLKQHRRQSLELQRQGVDLLFWPESGYPYILRGTAKEYQDIMAPPLDTPVVFGTLRAEFEGKRRRLFNSAVLVDRDGSAVDVYDKNRRLLVGEHIPLGDTFPVIYEWLPNSTALVAGADLEPLVWQGIRYGQMICYESLLTDHVRALMDHRPHVLVNPTNDAWFGDTAEPRLHFDFGRMRAIEQRRYVLRPTRTGITAVVDANGRVVEESPQFARANIVADVPALEEITVYQHLGDWPGWLAVLLVLYWLVRDRGRTLIRSRLAGAKRS